MDKFSSKVHRVHMELGGKLLKYLRIETQFFERLQSVGVGLGMGEDVDMDMDMGLNMGVGVGVGVGVYGEGHMNVCSV